MRLNKYFTKSEFECKCGCGLYNIKDELLLRLSAAREEAGVSFIISSGVRCIEHNKAVKGSPRSSHVNGWAVDIKCDNSNNRHKMMKALMNHGFNRIGIAKTFIHVDCDPHKVKNVIWTY